MLLTDARTMGRIMKLGVAVLVLLGYVLPGGYAQTGTCTTILNCRSCSADLCLQCNDWYATNRDGTGCCSQGCSRDADGYHQCNIANGTCTYQTCENGYAGGNCIRCASQIENCDDCDFVSGSSILHCTTCGTGYYRTTNNQQCCPEGCDSCTGDVCHTCKAGYYQYQDGCDTCGNNCRPPSDGSARCDSTTGACFYGCLDGWHGSRCDIPCTIQRCETCDYIEAADFLRCADCQPGYYGNNCTQCSFNCLAQTADICDQSGWCESGCAPGWRLDKCDRRCSEEPGMANCRSCERYEFKCTVCEPGYWGPTCQYQCSQNCVPNDAAQHTCNILDGTCNLGCLPGHYQADCQLNCPSCGGNDRCNITTGICLEASCDDGFFGTACLNLCPVTCAQNPSGNIACDFTDGFCTFGCQPDYYGATCQQECSPYCSRNNIANGPVCRQTDGYCFSACEAGYYNVNCNTTCEARCVDNTCDILSGGCAECNNTNPGYLCPYGKCTEGYWGTFCRSLCPDHCASTCHRDTGICDACVDGRFGSVCNRTCGNCESGTCDKVSGVCDSDCLHGWWGPFCNTTCLYPGCKECDKDTGLCTVCKVGLFGQNCERQCSAQCTPAVDGHVACDRQTGNCEQGSCLAGYYNLDCTGVCSPNCFPDKSGVLVCDLMTGYCPNGCPPTFTGNFCNVQCSVACTGNLCYQNGTCQTGCVNNRYGEQCQTECDSTCNDDTCNRNTGICEECRKPAEDQTALCRSAECPVGQFGLFCNQSCPDNCFNQKCARYSSICDACADDFWDQFCDKACGNCVGDTCRQDDGFCESGCDDGYYGDRCLTPCTYEGCQRCGNDGECIDCKPGLFGQTCDRTCSANCVANTTDGNIYCSKPTGACAMQQCASGYYTPQCTQLCNENCGAQIDGSRSCDIYTGSCDLDCELTFYGQSCDLRCPETCLNQNCDRTGSCREGCQVGYWDPTCGSVCQEAFTCNDGTCDIETGTCLECEKENPSPLCRNAECPVGFHGLFCNQSCPVNCESNVCDRNTGLCATCKNGFYGAACENACPNCKNNVCFKSSGECVQDCVDGWYTDKCDQPCLFSGCQNCDRQTGLCITCKAGFYGDNDCSQSCSARCTTSNGTHITCNKFSGACDSQQCIAGYWTEQCTRECSPYCQTDTCALSTGTCSPCLVGWYNQQCTGECSDRCRNKNCSTEADLCNQGCTDGYWGGRCEYDCSVNCAGSACNKDSAECLNGCTDNLYYGSTCNTPCSGNCIDNVCNTTGYCLRGCEVGYYGDRCQFSCDDVSKCVDGTCDRVVGTCSDCLASSPGPNCPTADCPPGKRGVDCDEDCASTMCLYNNCDRYGNRCLGCPLGRWGALCENVCANCREGTRCEQDTGVCVEGCRDGFYRDDCNTPCRDVCSRCGRQDGVCIDCTAGRWGPSCDRICSSNCLPTYEVNTMRVYCDKETAACDAAACQPGYWQANCTSPCGQNCRTNDAGFRSCALLNGQCDEGCVDTYYGPTCSGVCSDRCRNKLCKDFSNSCVLGCAEGFYGSTCAGVCSNQCAGSGGCDPSNGTCYEGCNAGYFGPRCDRQCINSCTDGTCASDGGCDDCKTDPIGTRCRAQVCAAGKYGTTCESDCPGRYCLENKCHRHTGDCEMGCLDRYHGQYCTEPCTCDFNGTTSCEQYSGECNCQIGRYGTRCELTCSVGCSGFRCEKDGKCTLGCNTGRYGIMCDKECTTCVDQECSEGDGTCLRGCVDGWYGQRCDIRCPASCKSCDSSGTCTKCVNSNYGPPGCVGICSSQCKPNGGDRTCQENSGSCIFGCQDGYYGDKCEQSCGFCRDVTCQSDGSCTGCVAGYYGRDCKQSCSVNCDRGGGSNTNECAQITGVCTYGCVDGYFGTSCSSECSDNCLNKKCTSRTSCTDGCIAYQYGPGCAQSCPNCNRGNCDDNGFCLEGCEDGFYGQRCSKVCVETCLDDSCDASSGLCSDCQTTPKGLKCRKQDVPVTVAPESDRISIGAVVGLVAGSAGVIIIFVILLVCCINYKRKAHDAKNEIHLPSDVLERLSTHRSLHSTVSTNYPVARVVGDDQKDFVLF